MRYFVNLSTRSIAHPEFPDFVRAELSEHPIAPGRLCFEITETALIADLPTAVSFIVGTKALGCQFALDDFGSGQFSFYHLKQLPVDYLKIDGRFVKRMVEDTSDRAVVETLHRVGRMLGLKTIAEWVESPQALEAVREIGVDFAQGYAIAAPAPLD